MMRLLGRMLLVFVLFFFAQAICSPVYFPDVISSGISYAKEDISTAAVQGEFLKRGMAEYNDENFEEAMSYFEQNMQAHPESSVTAFYIGLAGKQMGDYGKAKKYYALALNLTPPVLDAYAELIYVHYTLKEYADAHRWIAKAEELNVQPGKIFFLKGLVLAAENRNQEAINAFKKAEENDESVRQSADMQIAMAYARDKKFDEAKKALGNVISVDPNAKIADFAREFQKAVEKGADAYKTWIFTVGSAYIYDDNVVSEPLDTLVSSSKKADHAVNGYAAVEYRPLLTDTWFFTTRYDINYTLHAHLETFDTFLNGLTLTPGLNIENGAITLPVNYTYAYLGGQRYMWVWSVRPTLTYMLLPNYIVRLSAGHEMSDILKPPLISEEDRDATKESAGLNYIITFMEGKGMFNVGYEYSYTYAQGVNWENSGNKYSAGFVFPLYDKVSLMGTVSYLLQDYTNPSTVFFGIYRADDIASAAVNLSWEVIKNLNLNVSYSYTEARSNIPVYAYRKNTYMTGMEYRF
jgi:tetratricopeptide (TPR) repeat protein